MATLRILLSDRARTDGAAGAVGTRRALSGDFTPTPPLALPGRDHHRRRRARVCGVRHRRDLHALLRDGLPHHRRHVVIGGYILINRQDRTGVWTDVTQES